MNVESNRLTGPVITQIVRSTLKNQKLIELRLSNQVKKIWRLTLSGINNLERKYFLFLLFSRSVSREHDNSSSSLLRRMMSHTFEVKWMILKLSLHHFSQRMTHWFILIQYKCNYIFICFYLVPYTPFYCSSYTLKIDLTDFYSSCVFFCFLFFSVLKFLVIELKWK